MVKAKYFYEIECDESDKSLFMTSSGGSTISCVVMVFRYVIKTKAQQDLEWLVDKLIFCIFCMLVGFQLNINIPLQV